MNGPDVFLGLLVESGVKEPKKPPPKKKTTHGGKIFALSNLYHPKLLRA